MRLKNKLIGGAIISTLLGTTIYLSKNENSLENKLDKVYETNYSREPETNRRLNYRNNIISASPYQDKSIDISEENSPLKEDKTKENGRNIVEEIISKKQENIERKINRLSNVFDEESSKITQIHPDEDSINKGILKTLEEKKISYNLKSNSIEIYITPEMGMDAIFHYDGTNLHVKEWFIGEIGQEDLIIRREGYSTIASTHNGLFSKPSEEIKIKSDMEIKGFTVWNNIIRDIIIHHPKWRNK